MNAELMQEIFQLMVEKTREALIDWGYRPMVLDPFTDIAGCELTLMERGDDLSMKVYDNLTHDCCTYSCSSEGKDREAFLALLRAIEAIKIDSPLHRVFFALQERKRFGY